MPEYRLGEIESQFADLLWKFQPLTTASMSALAAEKFGWKRTTTYTVLKRLCDKGLFENQNGTVIAILSREEFYARQSEAYVEESFQGSLPAFLAAFGSRKRLSNKEIDELQRIIDSMREG